MGLDITAYRKLTKVESPTQAQLEGDEYDTRFRAHAVDWVEANWPGRTKGVEQGAVYTFTEQFGFRAGSYGGYNRWRDDLAKLAGYPLATHPAEDGGPSYAPGCWANPTGPFAELINFADNEGVIGSEVSAKLAKDFAEFDERAKTHGDEWFYESFCEWRKAFEMAADGGAVDFH